MIISQTYCSYDSSRWGPSGNYTINGTLTYGVDDQSITKRGTGAGDQDGVDLNEPPYAIHNGKSELMMSLDIVDPETISR